MTPIPAEALCANCPHTYEEHQGSGDACIAIVEVHERQQYCPCTSFELWCGQ